MQLFLTKAKSEVILGLWDLCWSPVPQSHPYSDVGSRIPPLRCSGAMWPPDKITVGRRSHNKKTDVAILDYRKSARVGHFKQQKLINLKLNSYDNYYQNVQQWIFEMTVMTRIIFRYQFLENDTQTETCFDLHIFRRKLFTKYITRKKCHKIKGKQLVYKGI